MRAWGIHPSRHNTATAAAEQEAGKKGARTMRRVEPAIGGHRAPDGGAGALDLVLVEAGQFVLSCLGRVPKLLRDNAKL
jgi:hypothetical protein